MVGSMLPATVHQLIQAQQQQILNQQANFYINQILGGHQHGGNWNAYQALYGGTNQQPSGGTGTLTGADLLAAADAIYQTTVITEPPRPKPIENAGIRAGEIIAHRVWRVRKGFLTSTYRDTAWPPGESLESHVALSECGYGDGIHAWKTASEALTYGIEFCSPYELCVVGTVALWGEVIEHSNGYRAQFAKVAGLSNFIGRTGWFGSRRRTLKRLRQLYDVNTGRQD